MNILPRAGNEQREGKEAVELLPSSPLAKQKPAFSVARIPGQTGFANVK